MANFTNQLNDNDKIKNELIKALKKTFRAFKFVIDNSSFTGKTNLTLKCSIKTMGN